MPQNTPTRRKKKSKPAYNCSYEIALRSAGFRAVCGVDEAGRGPLAGPVVAAAVILPPGCDISGITDSKKLTSGQREQAYDKIIQIAVDYHIALSSPREIETLNILRASLLAMEKAILGLTRTAPDFLLIDGIHKVSLDKPQCALKKGDFRSVSVAAASILAKVSRDRLMKDYDREYPGYGFARHKGYGTAEHVECLDRLGVCALHRRTFAPVRDRIARPEQGDVFDR